MRALTKTRTIILAALFAAGCSGESGDDALEFPGGAGGKADAFGRSLVGVAAPYEPDLSLSEPAVTERLRADMRFRRDVAWNTVFKILEPVPLLGIAEVVGEHPEVSWPEDDVPEVPRFQTWYGVDDFKRMFQHLYSELGEAGRRVNEPFGAERIAEAMVWNAAAAERSNRWPLDRYLDHVGDLAECPDELSDEECAASLGSSVGGAVSGTSRILYSPGTVSHILDDYGSVADCLERLDSLPVGQEPTDPDNFTACFRAELPPDAVLVKAQWVRSDLERDLPAFDTDAESIRALFSNTANWGEAGDRRVDPPASDVYTIRLRDGSTFRLAGLHIMTKETRHWQWVTLWWSDRPDVDFGADRPAAIRDGLPEVWSHYKMCAVSWFAENDPELARRYEELPTLQAALDATSGAAGEPSWCSNPYIEHGRNNASTNCIGCHQHGGSTVAFDTDDDGVLEPLDLEAIISDESHYPDFGRSQIRELFPADYLFSLNRVDDLSQVIVDEIEFFSHADRSAVQQRIDAILAAEGDVDAGASRFSDDCAACHGDDGHGSAFAPDLRERVPSRDDASLAQTLLQGRGGMPDWGERFDDQELADLLAFLRATFGDATGDGGELEL